MLSSPQRSRGFGAVAALSVLAGLASGAEETRERIERPSHGFSVNEPLSSWTMRESPGTQPGGINLAFADPDSGGTLTASVIATPVAGATPEQLRDMTLAALKGEQYRTIDKVEVEVAGEKRAALWVVVESGGKQYHARLVYFARDGMGYLLQGVAPADSFPEYEQTFQEFFESFRMIDVDAGELSEGMRLQLVASAPGEDVRWADSWEQAARIARQEDRLVLAYARFYSGFTFSDPVLTGALMDPDVEAMIRERFIPFRLTKERKTPLHDHASYGLSASSFGTSLIVCTPDGEVVEEEFCTHRAAIHDLLVRALEKRPEATGPEPVDEQEPLARAARLLRRGELSAAQELLGDDASVEGLRLRASLHRRLRQGPAARELLAAAREKAGAEEMGGLLLDEAHVLMGMGEDLAALELLEEFLADHSASERAEEARYWQGALLVTADSPEAARKLLLPLALGSHTSRWSRKAAALVTATGFDMGLTEFVTWPPENVMEALEVPEFAALELDQVDAAERDALRFVMEHQRADGSWINPAEASSPKGQDNELTTAVTAICGRSLVPHRADPEVAAAIQRTLDYLDAARARTRERPDEVLFMDYSIYANAYEIRFLAEALGADLIGRDRALAAMDELVERLQDKQKEGGGWSYYITSDLNSKGASNQSISFISAAATIALVRAEQSGVELPDRMLDRALGCLERMRNGNGTFEYFLFHDREGGKRNTPVPGAAGRGPVLAWALVEGGRRDLDEIREMLGLFFEHEPHLSREAGKALMHCGPYGQGSHYVLFDYATCAQAIAELPPAEQVGFGEALTRALLGTRTSDGAYLDNPLLGRAYGAAQALVVLEALRRARTF